MELADLDGFCGSPFWDWNTSWNTTDPDVTLCFEKTALFWSPCLFLWLFFPIEVYYLVHSRYRDIPWNWFNLTKLGGASILCVLSIIDIAYYAIIQYSSGMPIYSVDFYTPLVKLITFELRRTAEQRAAVVPLAQSSPVLPVSPPPFTYEEWSVKISPVGSPLQNFYQTPTPICNNDTLTTPVHPRPSLEAIRKAHEEASKAFNKFMAD